MKRLVSCFCMLSAAAGCGGVFSSNLSGDDPAPIIGGSVDPGDPTAR
jgi:hypothetical protein